MSKADRYWLVIGAVLGFLGVALGAFGAHGLQRVFESWGLAPADSAKRLQNWEVAVRYQLVHALALLVIGICAERNNSRWLTFSGVAFCLGVLVFSGCLYAYAFSGVRWFALIVPLGGVALLAGWLAFGIAAAKRGGQEIAQGRPPG